MLSTAQIAEFRREGVLVLPSFVADDKCEAVRQQLAFYGTTPAYRAVFELHDRGDLQPELARQAREGRWEQMASLIDDEFLQEVAVVGEVHEIAPALRARLDGISDSVSLVNSRAPDPLHFAEVVADLKS